MRLGYKYVEAGHAHVDGRAEEFVTTMGYGTRYRTAEEFLAAHDQRWVRELHQVLVELLDPGRVVLGIGSGEGEHEVLLHRAGYRVIASDLVPGVLDDTARLFEGLPTMQFDVFAPTDVECDDVLITGLDFYLDDPEAARMLRSVRGLLGASGRLILTLRYRDNAATWAIDRLALPAVAALQRRRGATLERKQHGFRRSPREVAALARAAGFTVGRVRHAAFGMEIVRFAAPPSWLLAVDRRLHVLNSAVVFELLPESG